MRVAALETLRTEAFPNLLHLRLHTDEGITGLGETFYGAEAVETHLHTIAAPLLLGEDPIRIQHHAAQLAGYTGYAGTGVETRARSAVDVALWDVLGQFAGLPVHQLLGGATRERIDIYNTCAGPGYVNSARGQAVANWGAREGLHEDLHAAIHRPAELARELWDSGVHAMKIWPFDEYAEASGGHRIARAEVATAVGRIAAVRDAVPEMEVMVELHALWDVPSALTILHALEPFEPFWVEDPVRSDVVDGLARVADRTPLRIAAGETVAGTRGFVPLLASGALGVVTVDTTWTGGLTAARDVAALAAAHGVPVAPHDCTGPVALAACVQLSTAVPNVLLQETVRAAYLGWYPSLVEGGPVVEGGTIRAGSAPGLGIRLQPDLEHRPGTSVRTTRHE